jgi:hypothetical protein
VESCHLSNECPPRHNVMVMLVIVSRQSADPAPVIVPAPDLAINKSSDNRTLWKDDDCTQMPDCRPCGPQVQALSDWDGFPRSFPTPLKFSIERLDQLAVVRCRSLEIADLLAQALATHEISLRKAEQK